MRYAKSMVLFAMLVLAAQGLAPSAHAQAVLPNIFGGATYGEWSARWWQWALSIPTAVNPILDTTGANCAQEQVDDVWFLAGNFGGTVTRACTIPAGKRIFFPLINNIGFKPFGFETLNDLRNLAAGFINSVTALSCTLDNAACTTANLSNFRVRSPSFTVKAPAHALLPPGFLRVPGNTDSIVSDGYWVLLSPLASGTHTLNFTATTSGGFSLNVTYNITVP